MVSRCSLCFCASTGPCILHDLGKHADRSQWRLELVRHAGNKLGPQFRNAVLTAGVAPQEIAAKEHEEDNAEQVPRYAIEDVSLGANARSSCLRRQSRRTAHVLVNDA